MYIHNAYAHTHPCFSCRKERRIFEAYQREAKAARDRKDKEEIEALRNEVECVYNIYVYMQIVYSRES